MSKLAQFRQRQLYWATLVALFVLIAIASALLISRDYRELRARQQESAESELGFLAEMVSQSLANEQYRLAEVLIERWGQRHPDTIYLSLETPDGYVLGKYSSATPGRDRYLVERRIEYGYERVAVITLETDLHASTAAARRFALEIAAGSAVLLLLFGQLLLLLDRRRQQRVLDIWAHQDGLTGIANRRRFEGALELEWRRARRNQSSIALIMADLDAFKDYNDSLGHQAGDDCLRQVAAALSEQVSRPTDLVARYGGEEFVVILPDTDLASAQHVAEQMRLAVAGLAIAHPKARVGASVTISLGVAAMVPMGEQQPNELIECADRLLYLAKRAGGDRFVSTAPEVRRSVLA